MADIKWKEHAVNGAVAVLAGKWISGIGFVKGIDFLQTDIMGVTIGFIVGAIAALAAVEAIKNR